MKMLSRPRQLWILALSMCLSIPLLVLNISVFDKVPVWKIFNPANLRLLLIYSSWVFITSIWILNARWRGFWSFGVMSGVVLYSNVYFLMHNKNYGLAFFALAFLIFSIFFAVHLYQTLCQVYFDSGREWYEGLPRFIPQLEASIQAGGKNVPARICRLGDEGCFIYAGEPIKKPDLVSMRLGEQSVQCGVKLISRTKDGSGMGVMFRISNQDEGKDLSDFIHRVRSFGYV